jgi:archaellum component FlaC
MNTQLLKQYNTQLNKLESTIKGLEKERNDINTSINIYRKQIDSLKKDINNLSVKDIVITEHALLRYFERVKGYNLEDIKADIIDSKTKTLIEFLNGTKGKVPWNENSLVVKDNTIVTIE